LSECKECTKELYFEFREERSVQEKTLTELLNTMSAQQGVLEHKLPRGNLYPFEERKGQRHLRFKQLKLKDEIRVVEHFGGRPVQGLHQATTQEKC
jgi:hypothetical protein